MRTAHYVLSTHWDREWYESFQYYRYRLVQLLDRVLQGFEDGRLRGPFQLDGQSIIIEDYLEVRPEKRPQVEQYLREGKLIAGPWYVLPDEFLVSGESIIRNLRLGRQIPRDLGTEPSPAGFVCDLFGHISQLPQVLRGFGIESGFLWRGLETSKVRHVIWEAPDGSEIACYHYRGYGYCDFAFKVRGANRPEETFDAETVRKRIREFLANEAAETEIDSILVFDGGDHQEWDQYVYTVLVEEMEKQDKEFRIVHSSLDEYLKDMLAQRGRISTRVRGELREPGKIPFKSGHQIHGVLSSRVWIKQQNAACQDLLCHWAEPMLALGHRALGMDPHASYLSLAWRHLIQNHPHDSICGCSIDQVHEDMKYRFSQARQIAERVTLEVTKKLTASVEGDVGENEVRVGVFNPLPEPFTQTAELDLEIPADWPFFQEFFGYEQKPAFRITGPDGKDIPYQRLGQTPNQVSVSLFDAQFPHARKITRVRVSLPLDIPALGYTTLTLRKVKEGIPTRHPEDKGLRASTNAIENEYLRAEVQPNGTLTVTEKHSGNVYTDLLTFEECADIGDGWFHGIAVNDLVHLSTAGRAEVSVIENGPYCAALRIRTTMPVPEEFDFGTMRRSEKRVDMVLDSIVRLRPGSGCLEVETTIHNNAKDHRVRVLFPSGAEAKTYLADSAFDVVERPIALRRDNHLYAELEVETKPQQSWTAVFDAHRGMSVLSTGLMESAVCDLDDRPVALTLLRGTRKTILTSGEPEGQLLGSHRFRYWVRPLNGAPDWTEQFRLAQRLAAGVQARHVTALDQRHNRRQPSLPPRAGWFHLEGYAVLTSSRDVDGALEVRLFNPEPTPEGARLVFDAGSGRLPLPSTARHVDFESNPSGDPLPLKDGMLSVEIEPKRIVTLRIE